MAVSRATRVCAVTITPRSLAASAEARRPAMSDRMDPMSDEPQEKRINPNAADLEQLTGLPGVGETLANRIRAARPYRDLEDLSRVSGLGDKGLDRIAPFLTFESETEPETEPEPEPERGVPTERADIVRIAPSGDRSGRPSAFTQVLAASVLTGLLSVGLTLGILLAINGTLNMGRHRQVQALDDSTSELAAETEALQRRMAGIDERLAALEGLTARMSAVEEDVSSLQGEVDAAVDNVSRMQEAVNTMERDVQALNERADRFDAFLDGLRDLLQSEEGGPGTGGSESGADGP